MPSPHSKRYLFPLLSFLTLIKLTLQFGSECSQIVTGDFFDLGNLQSVNDYEVAVSNQSGSSIYLNFCKKANTQCPNHVQQQSIAVFKSQSSCIPLTQGSIINGFQFLKLNKTEENEKDFKEGIQIIFEGQDKYTNPLDTAQNLNYSLSITLYCKADQKDNLLISKAQFNVTDGQYQVFGDSPKACPLYKASYVVEFFEQFKWVYVVLAFVIGTVECFFGFRLFKPTLFLVGFISGLVLVVIVLFSVWTGQTTASNTKGYIILVFAIFTGISLGFLLQSMARFGLMVTGGVLGFFFSLTLNALLLHRIHSQPPELPLYNAIGIFSLLGCIIGYEYHHSILIIATATIGAQQAVRSVGVVIGGYPNEFELAKQIQYGHLEEVPWTLYLYLAITVAMAAAGIFYQLKQQKSLQNEQIGASYLKTLLDTKIKSLKKSGGDGLYNHKVEDEGQIKENEMKEVLIDKGNDEEFQQDQELQQQEQEQKSKGRKNKKDKKKKKRQEDLEE